MFSVCGLMLERRKSRVDPTSFRPLNLRAMDNATGVASMIEAALLLRDMPILTYEFTDVVAFGAELSTLF